MLVAARVKITFVDELAANNLSSFKSGFNGEMAIGEFNENEIFVETGNE